ncbi:DUF3048 domain-containing protein, partial [Chloroflexota bacterium]
MNTTLKYINKVSDHRIGDLNLKILVYLLVMTLFMLFASSCGPNSPTNEIATPQEPTQPLPTDTSLHSPSPTSTTQVPTETPIPEATDPVQAYGPSNFPPDVNPLTGLVISDPSLLDRRPVAVKVQIFPRGQRPPFGISLADIVYDYYQNNGLTRFHAIFYGQNAERVSPIRSARLLDGHLIEMYKSIFAFGGADWRILSKLYNSNYSDRLIVEGSGKCPPMCRIDPNGYNFLVTNTEELSKYATDQGISNVKQNLDGMSFNINTPPGGQNGSQVFIQTSISSYARWDYETSSGIYLRFQDTQEDGDGENEGYEPLFDQLTNRQISAENVVILFVPHQYAYRSKSGQNEIIDILLNGSGTAYAYRDGQVFQVQWTRPANDSVLYLN